MLLCIIISILFIILLFCISYVISDTRSETCVFCCCCYKCITTHTQDGSCTLLFLLLIINPLKKKTKNLCEVLTVHVVDGGAFQDKWEIILYKVFDVVTQDTLAPHLILVQRKIHIFNQIINKSKCGVCHHDTHATWFAYVYYLYWMSCLLIVTQLRGLIRLSFQEVFQTRFIYI